MTLREVLALDYGLATEIKLDTETNVRIIDRFSKGYMPLQMQVHFAHREAWRNRALYDSSVPTDSGSLDKLYEENDLSRLYKIVLAEITNNPEGDVSKEAELKFSRFSSDCIRLNHDSSHVSLERDQDHHFLLPFTKKKLFGTSFNREMSEEEGWLINDYIIGRVIFDALKNYILINGSHVKDNPEIYMELPSPDEHYIAHTV